MNPSLLYTLQGMDPFVYFIHWRISNSQSTAWYIAGPPKYLQNKQLNTLIYFKIGVKIYTHIPSDHTTLSHSLYGASQASIPG